MAIKILAGLGITFFSDNSMLYNGIVIKIPPLVMLMLFALIVMSLVK